LPTPREAADPFEGQGPHGGLRGCPGLALLLVIALRPAGMPARCGGPLDTRLAAARWPLEAPLPPGLLLAACRHWCNARLFLPCGGRGIAGAWFATGDQEPGGKDGASPREGLEAREVGMVRGVRGDGSVKVGKRLQGDAARREKSLDQPGIGSNDAVISSERGAAGRA
jgi:hypothetical protein